MAAAPDGHGAWQGVVWQVSRWCDEWRCRCFSSGGRAGAAATGGGLSHPQGGF